MRDVGLAAAPDDETLDHARRHERTVVSHDTDFGTLLAAGRHSSPSFILVRSSDPFTAHDVATLILSNLDVMTDDLQAGAIITITRGHLRSRRLPVR